jgi:hypothetical protein
MILIKTLASEMSLLQTFNRITAAFTGDDVRTLKRREYFFPKYAYNPLWGSAGETEKPSLARLPLNIPQQRTVNPTNIIGGVYWKDSPITSDPRFWVKFHARKQNAWTDNYDKRWRLRPADFLPRTELRYRNIGDGSQVGALQPRTVNVYDPIRRGVVPFSSLGTRA